MVTAGEAFVDVAEFSRERARPLTPDDRREAILAAVVPLFRERGREVSSRELAEAAGVAEGTVFRAFGDKESLINAAIEKIFDPLPMWASLRLIDHDLPLEQILTQLISRLNAHFRGVVSAVIVLGLHERPPIDHRAHDEKRLAGILEELLAAHRDRLVLPVETIADYLRLVAFASALPMSPDLGDNVLAGLIARGILTKEEL
ncbi:MAG: TetR/AcrR family transcriptional regulator [Pseudolysinimonas sp.]|uniref:TetR/AcrR family transcriptional regulator n=1 Tax=Pseudolysinimonas sp. TaxID=2680009 RepID=UPI003265A3BB